jgi:hypothetical protein
MKSKLLNQVNEISKLLLLKLVFKVAAKFLIFGEKREARIFEKLNNSIGDEYLALLLEDVHKFALE